MSRPPDWDQSRCWELGGAGMPGGPEVEERSCPDHLAEADDAVDVERLLAGLEACRVADRRVLTRIVEPLPGTRPAPFSRRLVVPGLGAGSGAASDPWRIDADLGRCRRMWRQWVRPEWWTAPIRDEVRALMLLAPGPELITEPVRVGRAPTCVAYHGDPDRDVEAADPVRPGQSPWVSPARAS